MNNLARNDYTREVDLLVKKELQIANIPIFELPSYMNAEVKTRYIGLLNGFVFYRAWTYWVCDGYMPLETANYIYEHYKDLYIRAGGDCGNVEPRRVSMNPVYRNKLKELCDKLEFEEYIQHASKIVDDKTLPRYINCYHIDTQEGLRKLSKTIKEKNIITMVGN